VGPAVRGTLHKQPQTSNIGLVRSGVHNETTSWGLIPAHRPSPSSSFFPVYQTQLRTIALAWIPYSLRTSLNRTLYLLQPDKLHYYLLSALGFPQLCSIISQTSQQWDAREIGIHNLRKMQNTTMKCQEDGEGVCIYMLFWHRGWVRSSSLSPRVNAERENCSVTHRYPSVSHNTSQLPREIYTRGQHIWYLLVLHDRFCLRWLRLPSERGPSWRDHFAECALISSSCSKMEKLRLSIISRGFEDIFQSNRRK